MKVHFVKHYETILRFRSGLTSYSKDYFDIREIKIATITVCFQIFIFVLFFSFFGYCLSLLIIAFQGKSRIRNLFNFLFLYSFVFLKD